MNRKPISMLINEVQISLTDICNKSELPACILEQIVKNLYESVRHIASIQLKQDTEAYNKSQEDAKKQSDKIEIKDTKLTEPT